MRLLGDPFFLQFGVPLITVGLSVFLKYVSRNDRYSSFKREDLAVGLDLAVTALLIFIVTSAQRAKALPTANDLFEQKSTLLRLRPSGSL